MSSEETKTKPTVAIIGAGFSGICAFIQLQKKLGIQSQLFELSDDVGGTWKQNVYPGCGCDVPSHVYSLSSDLNPEWSHLYSPQAEILDYLRRVAKEHHIYDHTRFQTEVLQAAWIKEKRQWKIDFKKRDEQESQSLYFDILFTGIGSLRIPHIPEQFKSFAGTIVHTAAWDWSVNFKDQRVAIIGSGSSACQSLPFLAENASEVISYQRSPAWIFPRPMLKYPDFMKFMFKYVPLFMLLHRLFLYCLMESLYYFFGYPNSIVTKKATQLIQYLQAKKLESLNRPELIPALKPNYQVGCKRIVFSSQYIDAIANPKVRVIRDPIKRIEANGIVTENGQTNPVDILVLATGYKTQHGVLGNINILGEEGQSLTDLWDTELPQFYKSTITHGFPNMFMLLGPTTILGHHSVVLMIETQVDYAIKCIQKLIIERNLPTIEPTLEAQTNYMASLRSDLKKTVWTTSCQSWYKNDKGEVTNIYPNTVTRFKWTMSKFDENDYVK